MPITKDEATMLATLAVACRPHGASRWDAAGVVAALGKVKHLALPDVAMALIRAAEDREARTPAVITNTKSPCWRERNLERPAERVPYDPTKFCGTCGRPEHGNSDHPFVSVVGARQGAAAPRVDRLRAVIAESTAELCGHGVPRVNCLDHRQAKTTAHRTDTAPKETDR